MERWTGLALIGGGAALVAVGLHHALGTVDACGVPGKYVVVGALYDGVALLLLLPLALGRRGK